MPQIIRELFEKEFANKFGVCEAVAVNSGTSALIGALTALNLSGREVITTPFTFPSTVNAIVLAGGKPVFIDINDDCLLDYRLIEQCITPDTQAILPVHLFGRVCNMTAIMNIADKHNLSVVEDCAQSLGAYHKGKLSGTFGDYGCFSFYKTKNLSCFEGGMIIGNDLSTVRYITNPVCNKEAGFPVIGYNFRMPEPCCLIGYEKIKLHWNQIRSELGRYDEYDFYPYVIYELPQFKHLNFGQCPNAERISKLCQIS